MHPQMDDADMDCSNIHDRSSMTGFKVAHDQTALDEMAHDQIAHDQITRRKIAYPTVFNIVELTEGILSHLSERNLFGVARINMTFKAVTDREPFQRKMYLLEAETRSVEKLSQHFESVTRVTEAGVPSANPALRRIRDVVALPLRPPSSKR